jgi:hypothetical protein
LEELSLSAIKCQADRFLYKFNSMLSDLSLLTSATNLLQLQKKVRGLVKGKFEILNTRYGTRFVTKGMADFSAIQLKIQTCVSSY